MSFLDKILGRKPSDTKNDNNIQKTDLRLISGYNAICVDTIARHCAKFEPRHYKSVDGQRTYINGDINYLLANQPNPIMTTYDFIYRIIAQLYLQNNEFIYIDKDDKGFITGFYPVNYTSAEWLKDKNNNLFIGFWLSNGKYYILPYIDLIHLRRF